MSSNNIQVAIKVRPLLRKEKEQKLSTCWKIVKNSIQLIDTQAEPYYFDHIFDQDASNEVIFNTMAKHIVHSGVQGFNGTIFAYGQTSSGKTYTMMGDQQNPGVMVLAAKEIFKEIEKASERQFLLRVGYIEIYNEKIYDLLNKKNQDLKIHETPSGPVSVNCEECIITCEEDLLNYLCMGNKERTVGETNMNERSSRSHAIFRIIIESRKMDRSEDDSVNQSVLNLVDLAGSERADQTGARGTRLKEGGHINKSLLFLSNVIKTLSENNENENKYVSFRDSKLTRILQASLGGNALTSIICTIKPTAVEESMSTLSFAMRAKSIKNKPQVNEIVSDAAMMKRLEREINRLETELAEERKKNKSQIKVGQLEKRITTEELKIISSSSLHNIKSQKEKRRRTWCSATHFEPAIPEVCSNGNALPMPSMLPLPTMTTRMQIPKPSKYFTPQITMRNTQDPFMNFPSFESQPSIDEEHFEPGEACNFEMLTPKCSPNSLWKDCKTPKANVNLSTISITPKVTANVHSNLIIVENALVELQEFTNLENKLDIEHDTLDALKQRLEVVSIRNAELESERIEYIELKDEHIATTQKLSDCEKRCDDLEIQISKLTNQNRAAYVKISDYEKQLEELKKKIERLEMENREAVNLEFEYKSHQNKSKLRETELLGALAEKEQEIVKLEKSLNAITEERLQNSKEELLNRSRNSSIDETGSICVKCEDLQRLLEDNKKVTLEFEKLTIEYQQLQLNYTKATSDAVKANERLAELEQSHIIDVAECDKLRVEIGAIREKLEKVQAEYTQLSCDNNAKNEAYEELNKVIDTARKEMEELQVKYDRLEGAWQQQQQTLNDIQSEYDAIQLKYQAIQSEYEKLEHTSVKSLEDCKRLQTENETLQTEINELKGRVEEAQKKMVQGFIENAEANEKVILNLQQQNGKLKEELAEVKKQFEDMQVEYDDLSNQLMDNLQDNEVLREKHTKLEAELAILSEKNKELQSCASQTEEFEVAKQKLEEEIKGLKSEMEQMLHNNRRISDRDSLSSGKFESVRSESMRSSGVCFDEDSVFASRADLLAQFVQLVDSLHEIELEHVAGQRRVFRASDICKEIPYKMVIKDISEIISQEETMDTKDQICMQGTFARHTFKIMKFSNSADECEKTDTLKESLEITKNNAELSVAEIKQLTDENKQLELLINELKSRIEDLTNHNDYLSAENKTLVDSTERTIAEMRDHITTLSAELFEKSQFVERCACENYQKQIEILEKERADMTIMCEELQAKELNLTNKSRQSVGNVTLREEELKDVLNNFDEELEKFHNTVVDINSQLEQSSHVTVSREDDIKEFDPELSKTEDQEYEESQVDGEQKMHDLQQRLETVKQLLESKEKEYTEERNRLQLELYEKLEVNETEFRENLRKYNKEWEDSKDQYEATIADLKDKLLSNENQCKCATLAIVESESKRLEYELGKIQGELEDKTSQLNALEKQLNDANVTNQEKMNEIKCVEGRLLEVENRLEESTKNQLAKELEVSEMQRRLNELSDERQNLLHLHQDLEESKFSVKELEEQLVNIRKTYSEVLEEKSQLEKRIVQIEEEKHVAVSRSSGLQTECEELQRRLSDQEQQLKEQQLKVMDVQSQEESELNCKILVLRDENHQLNECIKSLEEEKCKLLYKYELMEDERKELQKKLVICIEEKNQLESECTKLTEEAKLQLLDLKNTENEREELSKKLNAQLNDFQNLRSANETLRKKIDAMTQDYESSLKTIADFRSMESEFMEEKKTLSDKIEQLSQELHEAKQNSGNYAQLVAEHTAMEKVLATVQTENAELTKEAQNIPKLQEQLKNFETLIEEKITEIKKLRDEYDLSFKQLKQEKQNLQHTINDYKSQEIEAKDKIETLSLKIERLLQDLHAANLKTVAHEKLVVEHEEIEKLLEVAQNEKEKLQSEVQQLKNKLINIQSQPANDENNAKITELENKLLEAVSKIEFSGQERTTLLRQLDDLREQLSDKESALRHEIKDLQSSIRELQLKCQSLQESNNRLQETNTQVEGQLRSAQQNADSCHALQKQLQVLHSEKGELEIRMKATVEEAGICSKAMCEDLAHHKELLESQLDAYNNLRALLDTKEAAFKNEKLKLEGTISCLVSEKKALEERNYATELLLKQIENELSSVQKKNEHSNTSMDANSSFSPRSRRSFERIMGENTQLKTINLNLEDKLESMQQKTSQQDSVERKNRRLSTHDERRRISLWGSFRDTATMTDPTDSNCNCVELDLKLKECEKNLYIRESQVENLNMTIKNHPLKAENIALKKRLQDEQEKTRIEIKKYKQIIIEQKAKAANALLASGTNFDCASEKLSSKSLVNSETQTDSELETTLRKLESKYNDLKHICRNRYRITKELEEQVALLSKEKENSSDNVPLSSLEAGQLKALKQQCETLKKDLRACKEKYNEARIVLQTRHSEIQSLRAKLQSVTLNNGSIE